MNGQVQLNLGEGIKSQKGRARLMKEGRGGWFGKRVGRNNKWRDGEGVTILGVQA
jgi:hypothetical protein